MQQFRIRQDGFKEIRNQILKRSLPILIIAVLVGISISFINTKEQETDLTSLFIVIPLVGASLGFGIIRGIKRQKTLLESYRLTITNNLITRDQANTLNVSIYFNDVKEIIKASNGSFVIKGRESNDIINIPSQIENYNELENVLTLIKPITTHTKEPLLQKYKMPFSLLTLATMFTVYVSSNKILVALSGCIFIVISSWSLYEIRRSKNIDEKTKSGSLWMFLVLASVIGVMIMKLTSTKI